MLIKNAEIIYYENVQARSIDWLWYPYIPYGKITIVQGDPGDGKTTLVLNLAALLSKGAAFPCTDNAVLSPVVVIYQNAEDGLEDTIKPRLEGVGANCANVADIQVGNKPLTLSDQRIEEAIIKSNAKLLVLDPLQAFIGSNVDMHRANDIRPLMNSLSSIAERTKCAIILVGHMNKSSNKSIYRGTHLLFDKMKTESAQKIILSLFSENSRLTMDEIYDVCLSHEISPRSVERAKKSLGIKSIKIQNKWYCEMPVITEGV